MKRKPRNPKVIRDYWAEAARRYRLRKKRMMEAKKIYDRLSNLHK